MWPNKKSLEFSISEGMTRRNGCVAKEKASSVDDNEPKLMQINCAQHTHALVLGCQVPIR